VNWAAILDGVLVGLLGVFVGSGELVSRYRDAPGSALRTPPALLYMALNGAAAILALALMRAFGWTLGVQGADAVRWTQVLAAGFGAMAVFRTSLFTIRVGDQEIGVGPISFLQVVLSTADRAVDRARAKDRSAAVKAAMKGIAFQKAYQALPAYAFALMQNLPEEDQQLFARQVGLLASAEMDEDVKTLILGLALMNLVGRDVLIAAVNSLREDIQKVASPEPTLTTPPA